MSRHYIKFKNLTHGRKIFWIPVIFAVAVIFSLVFVFITPSEGGYAAFMSMAIIGLIGYIYGPAAGFISAFLFGVAMFFLRSQVPSIDVIESYIFELFGRKYYWGEVADYVIGYTMMGFTGFFCPLLKKENATKSVSEAFSVRYRYLAAFTCAAALRFIEGVWNCWQFYELTQPTFWAKFGYCMWYSFWYIGVEALLSIVILLIPAVENAISYIAECAAERYKDNRNYL